MSRLFSVRSLLAFSVLFVSGALAVSCTSTSSSYSEDQRTQNVGQYGMAPSNVNRPRLGIPQFEVNSDQLAKNASSVAADQLSTLLINSGRFKVIERAQLKQLLDEQQLEGIVRSDERAKMGKVRGVDYLVIGKITNFKIQKVEQGANFGVGQVDLPGSGAFGGLDVDKDETVVKANVGVDLRIVNPETGVASVAGTSDYTRVNKASAMGVEVLGASASSDANLEIKKDNQGKILRLALDKTLQKMMPRIDRMLRQKHGKKSSSN